MPKSKVRPKAAGKKQYEKQNHKAAVLVAPVKKSVPQSSEGNK